MQHLELSRQMEGAPLDTSLGRSRRHSLVLSTLCKRNSRFTRKQLRSSLAGELYTLTEMWYRVAIIREFSAAITRPKPGAFASLHCGSLFSHIRARKLGAKKFLTRRFRGISGATKLDNVAWIPGTDNPADGPTKVKSEMGPLLRPLEGGTYRSRHLHQNKGVPFWDSPQTIPRRREIERYPSLIRTPSNLIFILPISGRCSRNFEFLAANKRKHGGCHCG